MMIGIEVQGMIDGKPAEIEGKPLMVTHYRITESLYVQTWVDGFISVVWEEKTLGLYDDEWLDVMEAIKQAMADKEDKRLKSIDQWLLENGDKTEHFGCSVTWSINEAKKLLSRAAVRTENGMVQVSINGEWLYLCRTDLMNDVCTQEESSDPEELREFYIGKIQYGARKSTDTFAVVDSVTDG